MNCYLRSLLAQFSWGMIDCCSVIYVEAFFLKVLRALEYHVVTRMVSPTEEPMQYLNEEPCWHLKGHRLCELSGVFSALDIF